MHWGRRAIAVSPTLSPSGARPTRARKARVTRDNVDKAKQTRTKDEQDSGHILDACFKMAAQNHPESKRSQVRRRKRRRKRSEAKRSAATSSDVKPSRAKPIRTKPIQAKSRSPAGEVQRISTCMHPQRLRATPFRASSNLSSEAESKRSEATSSEVESSEAESSEAESSGVESRSPAEAVLHISACMHR